MKKIFLLLFLLSTLLACNTESPKVTNIKLSESDTIYGKKINIPIDIYRPSKLYVYKNKLIILDNINKDIFKVFTIPNLSFCYSFGNIGPGPEEFSFISKESVNISEYFEILDRNKLRYYEFGDTLAEEKQKQKLIITKVSPINNFRKLNDSIYIYNNDDFSEKNNFELMSLNLNTKDEKKFGDSQDWSEKFKNEEMYQMRSKSICHSEQSKKTAVFYYHRPMFKIYSDSDVLLNTVIVDDDKILSELDEFGYNKNTIYFTESFATEKHIYVMWVNKNKQEIGKDVENFNPTLLVFNWNGELVNQYIMDVPIISFAVSEIENKLYATSFREGDINAIYEYDLLNNKTVASNTLKNEFYSLEMIKNYSFAEKDEAEINQIIPYGKYTVNGNYFGQGKNRVHPKLGAITILYYVAENLKLEEEIDALLKLNNSHGSIRKNINVNSTNVLHETYRVDVPDHDGKISTLYFNNFYFEISNKIIQIRICSLTENVDEHYNDFLSMISSFSVLK